MTTRFVIMANGYGSRWGDHLGVPKHLIEIDGETLLERIVRQIHEVTPDAEVVISAADPRYETPGAIRHVPERNEIELDRFVPELITDSVCFLYGDTFYTDEAIAQILETQVHDLLFYGDPQSIVAVRSEDAGALHAHLAKVRRLYLTGEIASCIGWQLYQSVAELPFVGKTIGTQFVRLDGLTAGFNTPEEYRAFVAARQFSR